MTKAEYLKKLNKAFGDFKFFEKGHYYEYRGQPVGISVTRFIEQYTNEFDAEAIAQKVAIRDGKTIQEVLDEWKAKNEWACKKGSIIHQTTQDTWKYPNATQIIVSKFFTNEQYDILKRIQLQINNFYNDYKDRLEHLADEFVIGSYEYDIASAIDHLFIDKQTGGLVLVDYKTNSDIHKNEKYAKNMKIPLSHLKDTTLNHYYIQLSIYRYLVEKYSEILIDNMFIVYMSENIKNYEIIEVPYLKEEVEKILEWRKWE